MAEDSDLKTLSQDERMAVVEYIGWDRLVERLRVCESTNSRDNLLKNIVFHAVNLKQSFDGDLHARTPWDAVPKEIQDWYPASTSSHTCFTYSKIEREETPRSASLHPEEQALITLERDREENPATVSRDNEESPETGSRDREESPATASEAASQALITLERDKEENPATGSRDKEESPNTKSATRNYRGVKKYKIGYAAEIEIKHRRIKLGVFESAMEAAKVYNTAKMKLRKDVPCSMQEGLFQESLDDATFLEMIKDGSYDRKLQEFKNRSVSVGDLRLFCKKLTKTDVSKQVLKIPKSVEPSHFGCEDMTNKTIEIIDEEKRSWPITYCPNQSALSRGWGNFVRHHNLKENDMVTFYKQHNGEILITLDDNGCESAGPGADSLSLIALNYESVE